MRRPRSRCPAASEVVANGRPIGRDAVTAGRRRGTGAPTEPMVPYLAFFAAGDFAVARGTADGRPWLVAVSQDLPTGPAGRPMTPDAAYARGACAGSSSELGDLPVLQSPAGWSPACTPASRSRTRPGPPTPPSAPATTTSSCTSWPTSGSATTSRCGSWRDIWLNEGFATYLEKRYDETHGGQPAATWLRNRYDALGRGSSTSGPCAIADPGPDQHLRRARSTSAAR